MRVPTHRAPTHPGEMLLEEFLRPAGLSQAELATAIHCPPSEVDALIHATQAITPSLALRLAKFFGMSADFWLTLQLRWDVYHVQQAEAETLASIRPHATTSANHQ